VADDQRNSGEVSLRLGEALGRDARGRRPGQIGYDVFLAQQDLGACLVPALLLEREEDRQCRKQQRQQEDDPEAASYDSERVAERRRRLVRMRLDRDPLIVG
jgi:hypothetical protein